VLPPGSSSGSWQTLFESRPCIPPSERFDPYETGGRLAWLGPRELLMTVGDHGIAGLSGDQRLAQDTATSYGKTIRIPLDGSAPTQFTLGHRNPQGLLVDSNRRLWSTEHGPIGGDELNLLVPGGNYGWPLASYGTQNDLSQRPDDTTRTTHAGFQPPALVLLPSPGISSLVELRRSEFPRWRGDLLVGSLHDNGLFRVRLEGDRVVYHERIEVGRPVRDLAEGAGGQVVIFDGRGGLVLLSLATPSPGERAYAACAGCHGADTHGTANGPSLVELFTRPRGTRPGFPFSEALRKSGGVWSAEDLDKFLRNPSGYAPGTSMVYNGVLDPEARRVLIEYLRLER
jgi:cytochrome c2